jgi:GNAT superfamily N-acetyltransferase
LQDRFLIRQARPDDAEAASRVYEASWDAAMEPLIGRTLGELVPFEERVAEFRRSTSTPTPRAQVWLAVRDEEIVGIAVTSVDGSVGELRALYVVPSEWGSGTSEQLHDAALDGMRSDGATAATLWVVEGNARARRFYEGQGWSADGETKPSHFDLTELRYVISL